MTEKQGLNIVQPALGSIGIFHAANPQGAAQMIQLPVCKDLAKKALATMTVRYSLIVESENTGTLLSPVLEVMKPIINESRGLGNPINSK